MQRFLLHGTTHRATAPAADLHDVGSLTLAPDLMDDAASVVPVVPSTRAPEHVS
jgi:aspartate 1-decarboxylase